MTKITYIPGEIANAAIDEQGNRKPVTRTQHIFDDAKGKSQAEVNADIDDTLALHQSEINALDSQNYVTVDSFNALPATGSADTVYRVSNWDGTQQNPSVYSEYAWNGNQYVHLSTKTQIGEVFDISAYRATGGTLATYDDLADALDSNNGGGVPQSLQKGGMSVKFVRTYDNKYVRYNLLAQLFTTDITQWAIDDGGVYVDNPEYVYVNTDKDGKILWAIEKNGNIHYGAGVPQQVIDYIQAKISELSLDEYEDIVAFLGNLIEGDKTLTELLAKKVDKEEGKSLIDTEYATGISYIENPEFAAAYLDHDDKILFGVKTDGDFYFGYGVPTQIVNYVNSKKAEILAEVQTNMNIALATKVDKVTGKGLIQNEVSESLSAIEDPEGRSEITTDSDGKTISYRDSDGVKHEKVGIETKKITLEKEGLDDLGKALKNGGYANLMDWSDAEFVEIPIPTVCAVLNIETYSQAETKGVDIPTYIQFWDKNGNYFRKPVLLNAQGNSSMVYHIKNQAIDLEDGSEIKFGNWPAFDSFHLKKYFIDVFRGQCIVAYWLTEQMYQTREFSEKRPWDYLNRFNDIDNANGSFGKDFDSGALAHPDGFPVHIFFNGVDAGIYAFNIKKARGNYNMKKDKQKQIILDGILGSTFWTANGDMTIAGVEDPNQNLWHDFEIRNPKISKDINGNKYDGDNPKEPSDDYATTKAAIARLTTAISSVAAESSTADKKAKFAEFFNIPFFIDYELISQVIYNSDGYRKNWIWCSWDGNLWCPTSYDMDSIFGQHWDGTQYVSGSDTEILGTSNNIPTGTNLLKGLYATELGSRYKELRDKGIFSVENIVGLLDKWIKVCGYENLKSDIEDICVSPYLENGEKAIDSDGKIVLIPNTPSYRDNTKTYVYPPSTGGWYNSVQRVQNWLEVRLSTLDTYYNYSQN